MDKVYANSIILTNDKGGTVKITVGEDGKIDIEETVCSVYLYPNDCLVREYLNWSGNPVVDFGGLTPFQVISNFLPFVGDKQSEFNGSKCYILCEADGKDELLDNTILINTPSDKVVKRIVAVDSNGDVLSEKELPQDKNIQQLTINMPRFKDIETQEFKQVKLPSTFPSPCPVPQPPNSCLGVLPPMNSQTEGFDPEAMPPDPFNIEDDSGESDIDPKKRYEVVHDDYEGNTYYNIALKRNFFVNGSTTQYFMVETMDKPTA